MQQPQQRQKRQQRRCTGFLQPFDDVKEETMFVV